MTEPTAIRVDVQQLLGFFDEEPRDSAGHASAIVAVAGEDLGAALLAAYLRSQAFTATVLPDRCTQGTKKGHRLDRWVLINSEAGELLYQVEIKNWSAHAIGGRKLALAASPAEVSAYKIERWAKEWSGTSFRTESVTKVLTPMRRPRPLPVEPLVCFWTAMHPDGAEAPLFTVPLLNHPHFSRVSVFSMSSYLRGLATSHITLPMPDVSTRRSWLARLFPGEAIAPAV